MDQFYFRWALELVTLLYGAVGAQWAKLIARPGEKLWAQEDGRAMEMPFLLRDEGSNMCGSRSHTMWLVLKGTGHWYKSPVERGDGPYFAAENPLVWVLREEVREPGGAKSPSVHDVTEVVLPWAPNALPKLHFGRAKSSRYFDSWEESVPLLSAEEGAWTTASQATVPGWSPAAAAWAWKRIHVLFQEAWGKDYSQVTPEVPAPRGSESSVEAGVHATLDLLDMNRILQQYAADPESEQVLTPADRQRLAAADRGFRHATEKRLRRVAKWRARKETAAEEAVEE